MRFQWIEPTPMMRFQWESGLSALEVRQRTACHQLMATSRRGRCSVTRPNCNKDFLSPRILSVLPSPGSFYFPPGAHLVPTDLMLLGW